MRAPGDDGGAAGVWAPPDSGPAPGPWGSQPWGTPPQPPDRRRPRHLRVLVALVCVVGLLLALIALSAVREDRRADRVRAEVAAALPELQAFVEQERGLPFLEPVDVEVLDDDAFLEALYAPDPDEPAPREDRDAERTLVALGLLDADTDLDDAVGDSLDEGVVGFYDPSTGELAIRGRELDAFTRLVLVHELTHALQDQHFDIDRPELDVTDDERATAFRSLVEGDAVRVETAWLLAQPEQVQRELLDAFGPLEESSGEDVVEALLGFPYSAGPAYAQGLVDGGGQPSLDAAFRSPPVTTEQVLDPGRTAGPVDVGVPQVDGDVVDAGVLGVLGLALLLDADPLEPGAERAWNGDRYVTAESGGTTCTTADVAVDGPAAGAALGSALESWAAAQDDALVLDGPDGTLRVRACATA